MNKYEKSTQKEELFERGTKAGRAKKDKLVWSCWMKQQQFNSTASDLISCGNNVFGKGGGVNEYERQKRWINEWKDGWMKLSVCLLPLASLPVCICVSPTSWWAWRLVVSWFLVVLTSGSSGGRSTITDQWTVTKTLSKKDPNRPLCETSTGLLPLEHIEYIQILPIAKTWTEPGMRELSLHFHEHISSGASCKDHCRHL